MLDSLIQFLYRTISVTFIICATISPANCQSVITTIAGNGITQYIGDGYPATNYSLALPQAICMDNNGNLLIADNVNARIRLLTPNDTIKTIIGDGTVTYSGDSGPASAALLKTPVGVCVDTAGNLYITDWYDAVVRKVDAHTGIINTVAGNGVSGYGGDGGPATAATLQSIGAACIDKSGNIYIPDYGNHRIRKVDAATRMIHTIAGNGTNGYLGDGGPATSAALSNPNSACVDTNGNVYFTENGNHTVRRIDANSGIISTVAGKGAYGYSGDGGPATAAYLNEPNCVFIDSRHTIFISDKGNNVIRAISETGTINTIAGSGGYGFTGDGGTALAATFNNPSAVFVDHTGVVYVADGQNSAIRKINYDKTAVNELSFNNIKIYPNPNNGTFCLTTDQPGAEYDIQIFNIMGQLVYEKKMASSRLEIAIRDNLPGLYFLHCSNKDQTVVGKFVIR